MKFSSYSLFFRALNNAGRFAIIELLKQKPCSVQKIADELGMEQSLVSHNLRCLTNCGFVATEKKGNHRIYALDTQTVLPILNSINKHILKFEKRLVVCGIINPKKHVIKIQG